MCMTSKVQDPNPGFFFFFFFWGGGGGCVKKPNPGILNPGDFLGVGGGGGGYVNKSRESCHFLRDTFSRPVCHNCKVS